MNILEMIQKAKRLVSSPQLDETSLSTEVDSALPIKSWVGWVNDSQNFHMNLVMQASQEYFGTQGTISLKSGTQEYDIPDGMIELRLIERTDTDPDGVIYPTIINDRLAQEPAFNNLYPFRRREFSYLWGNMLGIAPEPIGDETINVMYIRQLPELSYGTAGTTAAGTIILEETPDLGTTSNKDDYYNGCRIYIVSATTGAGQTVTVSDYVGSTRTATLKSDFGTTPTGTIVYAIVCDIPERFHEAVYLYAAIMAKMADDEDISQLENRHGKLVNTIISGLIPRQSQKTRGVRYITDNYYPY